MSGKSISPDSEAFKLALGVVADLVADRVVERLAPFVGQPPEAPKARLTQQELAHELNISVASIVRFRKEHPPLPVHYVGSSPRYNLDEVEAWLAARADTKREAKRERELADDGIVRLSKVGGGRGR